MRTLEEIINAYEKETPVTDEELLVLNRAARELVSIIISFGAHFLSAGWKATKLVQDTEKDLRQKGIIPDPTVGQPGRAGPGTPQVAGGRLGGQIGSGKTTLT